MLVSATGYTTPLAPFSEASRQRTPSRNSATALATCASTTGPLGIRRPSADLPVHGRETDGQGVPQRRYPWPPSSHAGRTFRPALLVDTGATYSIYPHQSAWSAQK